MFQQFVKTFFIGQVICEQVATSMQDVFSSTKCKAGEKLEQMNTQIKEATADKGAHFFEKLQVQCKDAFINLRQNNESVEKACESLERLLAETSDVTTISSALD